MSQQPDQLPDAALARWPAACWSDVHVLVAVSGGADSVAMLRSLQAILKQTEGPGQLLVAHFNHKLRGQAAEDDARWVEQLADSLGLAFVLGEADPQSDLTSEQRARDARYDFLRHAAHRVGARYVALGHTADDQVETVLHRVLRGSGLAGLRGVPPTRPLSDTVEVVRPLLAVPRSEVERYLAELGQDYRADATNEHADFTRNRLRHMVMPMLRAEIGAQTDEAILRLSSQAAEAQEVIESLAAALAARAIEHGEDSLLIHTKELALAPPLIVREACKLAWRRAGWPEGGMGAVDWERLFDLLTDSANPGFDLPGGVHAEWDEDRVLLSR